MKLEDLIPAFSDADKKEKFMKLQKQLEDSLEQLTKMADKEGITFSIYIGDTNWEYIPEQHFNHINKLKQRKNKLASFDDNISLENVEGYNLYYTEYAISEGYSGWISSYNIVY